jgi:hypothetical protein
VSENSTGLMYIMLHLYDGQPGGFPLSSPPLCVRCGHPHAHPIHATHIVKPETANAPAQEPPAGGKEEVDWEAAAFDELAPLTSCPWCGLHPRTMIRRPTVKTSAEGKTFSADHIAFFCPTGHHTWHHTLPPRGTASDPEPPAGGNA